VRENEERTWAEDKEKEFPSDTRDRIKMRPRLQAGLGKLEKTLEAEI